MMRALAYADVRNIEALPAIMLRTHFEQEDNPDMRRTAHLSDDYVSF
jgi:hypothetical protein